MEKNTKILLGLAAVGVVAYLLWEKSPKDSANDALKASFVSADGKKSGEPCTFNMNGEVLKGKISEIDSKYCFTTDGKRGLAI